MSARWPDLPSWDADFHALYVFAMGFEIIGWGWLGLVMLGTYLAASHDGLTAEQTFFALLGALVGLAVWGLGALLLRVLLAIGQDTRRMAEEEF